MTNDRPAAVPDTWGLSASPLGVGHWLIGRNASSIMAIVPPGVPATVDEPMTEQVMWRLLAWAVEAEGRPWEDASRHTVRVGDVVKLLPVAHKRWVRAASSRQLKQLELWTAPGTARSHEERAHEGTRLSDALRAECREAFPGEDWHQSDAPEMPAIPETADALLHRIDFPDPARAEEVWNKIQSRLERAYYAGVTMYRWMLIRRAALLRRYDRMRQLLAEHGRGSGAGTAEQQPVTAEQDTDQHEALLR